jgi:hypothetical protein
LYDPVYYLLHSILYRLNINFTLSKNAFLIN